MADLDRRLVDLHDLDNPDGPDHDLRRTLADERGARRVLDLGCGTGLLTVTLAVAGREVVGVDPSATMLDRARQRRWTTSERSVRPTGHGPLEEWSTADEVAPGVVRLVASNRFADDDQTLEYT